MTTALAKSFTKRFTNRGEQFALNSKRLVHLSKECNGKEYISHTVPLSKLKSDIEAARARIGETIYDHESQTTWTVEFLNGCLWIGCKSFTRENTATIMKALGLAVQKKAAKKRTTRKASKRARVRR